MKILFLNNLQWGDVQGRQHEMYYAAVEAGHDCTVVDPRKVLRKHGKTLKNSLPAKYRQAHIYPYQYESKVMHFLTNCSYKRVLKDVDDFDVVWIGGPELYAYLPKTYHGKVIFDCMDNYEHITSVASRIPLIHRAMVSLLKRADLTLVTAEYLDRYVRDIAPDTEPLLVRNAYEGDIIMKPSDNSRGEQPSYASGTNSQASPVGNSCPQSLQMADAESTNASRYTICFYGAIAKWVDTQLMYRSALNHPSISYRLIGNLSVEKIDSPQMEYIGAVVHSELPSHVMECDALIMPFFINELTKAVDPVKLYEYVAYGKCIICCYYDEIARFDPYVYFYHDEKELNELLDELIKEGFPPKFTDEMQKEFLEGNTWKRRFEIVDENLKAR